MSNLEIKFHPKLDAEFLHSFYGGEVEQLQTVFEFFLNDIDGQMELLSKAVGSRDAKELKQLLHKIKPTFSYVGLSTITEEMNSLEAKCAETGDFEEITPLYNKLTNNVSESLIILRDEARKLEQIQ
jgi:HPt (histidine-containing phosphotransfer) domain-containing protein